MSRPREDQVTDRALDTLRRVETRDLPSVALEQRLREGFVTDRRRVPRSMLILLVSLLIAGTTAAPASVGWLGGWWFAVEVDGQEHSGWVSEDGMRTLRFTTAEGDRVKVVVEHERLSAGQARTAIAIDREQDGGLDEEREEFVRNPSRTTQRYATAVLADCYQIYQGRDAQGQAIAFYVTSTQGESRVFVHRIDQRVLPVEEVARVPHELLSGGANVRVFKGAAGGFVLRFDGPGEAGDRQLQLEWPTARTGDLDRAQTPDGRVRVKVRGSKQERGR